tara:strand:+ start:523 stop:1056 length:534 start_codon:yes stop_codon:yes gene_type:complete
MIKKTKFDNLFIINHKCNFDNRGGFFEIFRKQLIEKELGYSFNFCQENLVNSSKNVLRGLHFQANPNAQSKLISVFSGKIFDIAVDIRKNSKTYGKYFSISLASNDNMSLFIPKGFAHGYISLENNTLVSYKVDNYYDPESEYGISYDDKYLNIDWGVNYNDIIISEKDKYYDDYIW